MKGKGKRVPVAESICVCILYSSVEQPACMVCACVCALAYMRMFILLTCVLGLDDEFAVGFGTHKGTGAVAIAEYFPHLMRGHVSPNHSLTDPKSICILPFPGPNRRRSRRS